MNPRWRRALLKLYPSGIRRRYGEELLDLQAELRNHGEISTIRLLRDAIAGAFLARSVRQRALILGGGLLLAALIASGVALRPGTSHRTGPPIAVATLGVGNARPAMPYGQTCLVSSGLSCSPRACAMFTAQPTTVAHPTEATSVRRTQRAQPVCVGVARAHRPRNGFVSSSQFILGPAARSQPPTDTARLS